MFGRIRLTYWETLRGRAWILTRDLFGWSVKTCIVTVICFVAALALHAWSRGSKEALDNLIVTLIYTVPFAAGGLATFVVNVLRAAQIICIKMAGMTQMEAHAAPLSAGTPAAAALVASEKTLYVAYALNIIMSRLISLSRL